MLAREKTVFSQQWYSILPDRDITGHSAIANRLLTTGCCMFFIMDFQRNWTKDSTQCLVCRKLWQFLWGMQERKKKPTGLISQQGLYIRCLKNSIWGGWAALLLTMLPISSEAGCYPLTPDQSEDLLQSSANAPPLAKADWAKIQNYWAGNSRIPCSHLRRIPVVGHKAERIFLLRWGVGWEGNHDGPQPLPTPKLGKWPFLVRLELLHLSL